MAKKSSSSGIVYSTDPHFAKAQEEEIRAEKLLPKDQLLKLRLDAKQRAGKAVTLVEGYVGGVEDINHLGKALKALCGSGGSVKDGIILVQGDHRDKVLTWLHAKGYTKARRG